MPKNDKNFYKYESTNMPICPYCDKELDDKSLNYINSSYAGGKDFICPYCKKHFVMYLKIEKKYNTYKNGD